MSKSPDAFRTISEVAEYLQTPAHVLRFWETKFPQIRPVKRAGGRRYYRPVDVALLISIKCLLHDDGFTIRGVQKMLREQGSRQIAARSQDLADRFVETGQQNIFVDDLAPNEDVAPDPVQEESAPPADEPLQAAFARLMPEGLTAAPTADSCSSPPPAQAMEEPDTAEAPIALWVEEDMDDAAAGCDHAVLPFPAAPEVAASQQKNNDSMISEPVMILDDMAEASADVIGTARQMARLRALRPDRLSYAHREELGCLRDLAQDLLGRLAS